MADSNQPSEDFPPEFLACLDPRLWPAELLSSEPEPEVASNMRYITKSIKGRTTPISARVLDLIDQWHRVYPEDKHPAEVKVNIKNNPPLASLTIYDRDGEEHEMTVIEVGVQTATSPRLQEPRLAPLWYKLAIYHSENGPDELVTIIRNKGRKWQSEHHYVDFLLCWQGVKEGFENKVCAVRAGMPLGKRTTTRFYLKFFEKAPEHMQ